MPKTIFFKNQEANVKIIEALRGFTNEENILLNEPMKNHTTFKIGGNADYIVMPETKEQAVNILSFLEQNNVSHFVIGNGSNLLVKDEGYRGVIVKLGQNFSSVTTCDGFIKADAGALLSKISNAALSASLTGFEELSGIPGSLGGAIFMNAGAYGKEIKDVLYDITYINKSGEVKTIKADEVKMEYRETFFSDNNFTVLGATLKLNNGDKEKITGRVREVTKLRTEKQPLNFPSAGSTFKRPVGYFAGKLIEDCGLKGYSVGGAKVSEKHAGFIINYDNASFKDVYDLTEDVKKIVKEKFDVELELEVKVL